MKTIEYETEAIIECPVCHKIVLDDTGSKPGEIQRCKHILTWYNSICGDFVIVHKSIKKDLTRFKKTVQAETECVDEDFFNGFRRNKAVTVLRYIGDDLSVACTPIDIIAFKK